jgi:hypothetical protein
MKTRDIALLTFGFFLAASAAFVTGYIALATGLRIGWAAPIAAVVFIIVVLTIYRH